MDVPEPWRGTLATSLSMVDDLDEQYARADVVVSPLFAGAGLKIKCVDALSRGKACVVSRNSASGIQDGAGAAFVVAETCEEFAGHVSRLLSDPAEVCRLERAALDYVSRSLRPQTNPAPLIKALAEKLAEKGLGGSKR